MADEAAEKEPVIIDTEQAEMVNPLSEWMNIPDLQDIQPEKNKENWLKDGLPGEEGEDDHEEYRRTMVELETCPFGGECKHHNWRDANVWSVESPRKCLQYAMQHAMNSAKHNMSEDEAYQVLCSKWVDLPWKITQDTYKDRDRYARQIQASREGNKRSASVASHQSRYRSEVPERSPKRSRQNYGNCEDNYEDAWGSDSSWGKGKKGKGKKGKKGKDDDESVIPELANQIAAALTPAMQAVAQAASSAAAPAASAATALRNLGQRSAAISDIDAVGGVMDITHALQGTLADDHVAVPKEALLRLQQNLQSAEHCLSRTMQEMVRSAKSMRLELENLQRSIEILAQHTGHPAQHLQRII